MNKIIRNFWLDMALYLLLGINIAIVNITPQQSATLHPAFGWHVHAVIGTLLTVGSIVHIVWHWQWFHAVLTGKAKGKIKMFMVGMVTVFMILASLSGHEEMHSAVGGFHDFTGSMALIGLFIHSIKHIRWIAMMTKKLVTGGGQNNVIQSA